MKRKIGVALAAVPLLVLAGVASAEEPMQLSDGQMDTVTAAGSAFADAFSLAVDNVAFTQVATLAKVDVVGTANGQATTINLVRSLSKAAAVAATGASVNGNNSQ